MAKLLDLTGQRFGKLLVIERGEDKVSESGRAYVRWRCLCDCGNIKDIASTSLIKGTAISCGCMRKELRKENFIGKKFGRLTVLEQAPNGYTKSGDPYSVWKCVCDCGNIKYARGCALKNGHVKSCGCLNRDITSEILTTHGESKTRLYGTWINIKKRCYKETVPGYENYGGRGIRVCDEWLHSYANFRDWAYQNGYSDDKDKEECSIDRIDVNGNYCPENCRWVSRKVQNNNSRHNHYIEYNGEKHTIAEWAEILGIKYKVLLARIVVYHWTIDRAFTQPVDQRPNRKCSYKVHFYYEGGEAVGR